jgi:hypothetical protein
VSTFRLEPEHLFLTTGTFNLLSKTDPHSRLSGAPSVRPNSRRNSCVLETLQTYPAVAATVNPLQSQDFHLFSTARGASIQIFSEPIWRTLLPARPKTRFHLSSPQNPAQAEAEDDSKIKDRLEALLFAETLQGTLSPNANPGKGPVGGLLIGCHERTRRLSAQLRHSFTCPRLDLLYQTARHCARGEMKIIYAPVTMPVLALLQSPSSRREAFPRGPLCPLW